MLAFYLSGTLREGLLQYMFNATSNDSYIEVFLLNAFRVPGENHMNVIRVLINTQPRLEINILTKQVTETT